MKKCFAIAFAALIAIALIGCGSSQTSSSASQNAQSPASANASSNASDAQEATGQYKTAESAEEAAANAGLKSLSVPDELSFSDSSLSPTAYESIDAVAQVIYEGDGLIVQVRKAPQESGTYVVGDVNAPGESWTTTVGSASVSCFGASEGDANRIEWSKDDFSYMVQCISLDGSDVSISEDDMAYFISAIE